MARIAKQAGESLKRRNPGGQARVSGNEFNYQEENVMSDNSTAVSNVIPFVFEANSVRVQAIDGAPWFGASDVCSILGYRNAADAVAKHCREAGIAKRDISSGGQMRSLSFINEGNLYRLIIKSRKEEAQRFESWVCDEILPSIRKHGRYEDSKNTMATLVGDVIGSTGEVVLNRVIEQKGYRIAPTMQRSFIHTMKSRLRSRFNVQKTSLIPADQMEAACNFIAAYAIEGEYLGKEEAAGVTVNWPASRWLAESHPEMRKRMTQLQGAGNMMIAPDMLFGPAELLSPTLRAIAELEKQGHNLEACRLEVLAMKHHLEGAEYAFSGLRLWADRTQGKGVRFSVQEDAA